MSVMSAVTFFPLSRAMRTMSDANSRASASVFMKAPLPHLTSRTRQSIPSASFLPRMLAAMSSFLSTVAVTSRRAYSFLSAGASAAVCPMIEHPTFSTTRTHSPSDRSQR